MKYTSILAATVAVGALVGVSAPVQAKVVKRTTTTTRTASSSQAAEIRELRAQLQELKARLDARESAPQAAAATQADIADAKNQAAAAQAAAVTAQASADKALASADKAGKDTGVLSKAVDWAKDTKISGRMYFNASAESEKNAAGSTIQKDGGFQIKRFYVGIDHKFNSMFSGNVTMDIDNVVGNSGVCGSSVTVPAGAPTATTISSCNLVGKGFYVKKAYLKASFYPAFNVALGATDMPWIPYVEGIYGYRHIEKTISDLNSYGTSADWGVHAMGDYKVGDATISYQVSAVDGGTYRNPTFSQTIDLEGRLSAEYKGFNAAVGGYTGKRAKNTLGAAPVKTANRLDALLAYKGKINDVAFTVGGEYLYTENWGTPLLTSSPNTDKAYGFSGFASVSPIAKWSVFGRYDYLEESPTQHLNYYNAGVQYSPAKIVDIALVYKHYDAAGSFTKGDLATGALAIGAAGTTIPVSRDEFGLFGQFRF